jgi:hypothetical protein
MSNNMGIDDQLVAVFVVGVIISEAMLAVAF